MPNIHSCSSTGRQLEHWHTGAMTRRASTLDALEPGAVASVSRGTIAQLGIRPGDLIRVSTRRGMVELAARQDDSIPDGVVFIPFAFAEAAANLLTNPALDPFGKIPEFKYCAAKARTGGACARMAADRVSITSPACLSEAECGDRPRRASLRSSAFSPVASRRRADGSIRRRYDAVTLHPARRACPDPNRRPSKR